MPVNPATCGRAERCARRLATVVLLACAATTSASAARAQQSSAEISAGASSLLVLGPLSGRFGMALEASGSVPVSASYRAGGGVRLGLGPLSPELFGRVAAAPVFGSYLPSAGLELGLSARGDDDSGDFLLAEGREASLAGLSPFYVGVHTTPLRFRVFERFVISALELQVGTHLIPLGRFVRVHVGLIAIGVEP